MFVRMRVCVCVCVFWASLTQGYRGQACFQSVVVSLAEGSAFFFAPTRPSDWFRQPQQRLMSWGVRPRSRHASLFSRSFQIKY